MPDAPDHPYRPSPSESEADAELRRMAAQGQERILAETTSQAAAAQKADDWSRDARLRVALGLYYGPYVRPAPVLCVAVLMELTVVEYMAIGHGYGTWLAVLGFLLAMGAIAATLSPPVATRARVAAERTWATSLPFAMDGYFEALATESSAGCRLVVSLQWADAGSAPRPEIVQGMLDARGQAAPCEDASVSLRSGPISCYIAWRNGPGAASRYFNHRLVAYMHSLVDKVLLPLQRSHPISRVTVSREGLTSSDEIREVFGLPPDR